MSTAPDSPAIYLRWPVKANINTHNPTYSPRFKFQGVEWKLVYNLTQSGRHSLLLERTSRRCKAFRFSTVVHLESAGARGNGKFSVSPIDQFPSSKVLPFSMSQRGSVNANNGVADYVRLWERPSEDIRRADDGDGMDPKLELRFLVMLGEESVLTGANSVCTQSYRPLSVDAPRTESAPSLSSAPLQSSAESCSASLSEDLAKLLDGGSNLDVEFECGGQTIGAHRLILCARSPVIASMLSTDMVEGRTGKVKIPDMEPDVFRHFLKYIYCGRLPELSVELALSLYESGDQYAVYGLTERCSEFLVQHLTVRNACRVLSVADAHSAEDFKEAVVRFILKEQIPLSGEHWRDFCSDHPNLANEVLNRFCQKLSEALKASQSK